MQNFGSRLHAAMLAAGMTDRETLANAVKVSRTIVGKWLSSEQVSMSAANLVEVAAALNVRPDWLATGQGTPQRVRPARYTAAELLRLYAELEEPDRIMLMDIVHSIMRARVPAFESPAPLPGAAPSKRADSGCPRS